MAVGRYLDDAAVPTITVAGLDPAADYFLAHDDSNAATPTSKILASQVLDRLLSTSSISHLTAMAAIASVELANDEFIMRDATTGLFVRLTGEQVLGRVLNRANISGLSNFTTISSVDTTNDRYLVWDASAGAFVTMTASALLSGVMPTTRVNYTSTPTPVTTAMDVEVISNYGATQVVEFDLPAATGSGRRYVFQRIAEYAMRLDPNGTETVNGGMAGKYLEMQSRGRIAIWDTLSGGWDLLVDSCAWDWEL